MKKIYILFILALSIFKTEKVKAQYYPLVSQYYNNSYLANPALAGIKTGYNLNLAYRKQWNNLPGSPEIQSFTGTFGSKNEKVGLGLKVNFDKAGLQKISQVAATYAYHIPLNVNKDKLHFGASFGLMSQRLNINEIIGNPNDPQAFKYNDRKNYIDGDFGMAYTSNGLKLEAALPNLKRLFSKEELVLANINTFYTSVSYVISVGDSIGKIEIEPKLVYRGLSKLSNVWDIGTQFSFANNQLMLTGIYHSTESASFSLSTNIKQKYLISVAYTTQTGPLNTYVNGSFEINLGIKL